MKTEARKKALLALEDGRIFQGWAFGADREAVGEVVFNTSMTGYQEVLTDPSYKGQIVNMTYPLIGNYGINEEDVESRGPKVEGFVVRELCRYPSNWRSSMTLDEYLKRNDVPGIEGIDTRALTKHIRTVGAMRAAMSCRTEDGDRLIQMAREWTGLVGQDMVKWVTCANPYQWSEADRPGFSWDRRQAVGGGQEVPCRVVAMDFGIKFNIARILSASGCAVRVVPGTTSAKEILSQDPDGVFLSNGPGDPAGVTYAIDTVKEILGKVPIFGICLGHQILSLAAGARTFKMKFGHRGANQPVMDRDTGRVHITSQNHGFCVDESSLDPEKVRVTHLNLNDQTLEGIEMKHLSAFSVQYHPEASPGPHDSMRPLFRRFVEMMRDKGSFQTGG